MALVKLKDFCAEKKINYTTMYCRLVQLGLFKKQTVKHHEHLYDENQLQAVFAAGDRRKLRECRGKRRHVKKVVEDDLEVKNDKQIDELTKSSVPEFYAMKAQQQSLKIIKSLSIYG